MNGLEQMLEFAPRVEQKNAYATIDVYAAGTVALYTTPIIPNYGNNVIPYGDLTGFGGDTHDTFKIDRYDNIYGGHTTVNIPGYNKLHIDWNDNF